MRRHDLDEATINKAIKAAVARTPITKPGQFALQREADIRTIRKLLGAQ